MPFQDDEPAIKKMESNPLSEIAELRLAVSPDGGEAIDVACQLRFSTGEVCVSGREYSVGISQARLQLTLEGGCETALGGCDYGSTALATAREEKTHSTQLGGIGGAAGGGVCADGMDLPTASGKAEMGGRAFSHVICEEKTLLPMKRCRAAHGRYRLLPPRRPKKMPPRLMEQR